MKCTKPILLSTSSLLRTTTAPILLLLKQHLLLNLQVMRTSLTRLSATSLIDGNRRDCRHASIFASMQTVDPIRPIVHSKILTHQNTALRILLVLFTTESIMRRVQFLPPLLHLLLRPLLN